MKTFLPLSILVIFFTSCFAPYHATTNKPDTVFELFVDSYGNDDVCKGKKCVLIPEDTGILTYDLQYLEFYSQLKDVFTKKAYHIVPHSKDADYAIYFRYGLTEADDAQRVELLPVYGKVGGAGTLIEGEGLDLIGYKSVQNKRIKYTRFLYITAYDMVWEKAHHERKVVWQAEVESTGGSDDLRRVFPVLLAGSEKYLGRNSGVRKKIQLRENASRVAELRADY